MGSFHLTCLLVFFLFSCLLIPNNTGATDAHNAGKKDAQKKITNALGLDFAQRKHPKRNLLKKYSAPTFMLRLYKELEKDRMTERGFHINQSRQSYITERRYLEENQVDTVISFFKYEHEEKQRKSENEIKIKFHIKINYAKENVHGGEFKIFKRRPRKIMTDILCNITVYKIGAKHVLLDTRVAHSQDSGWFSFNVTRAIRQWSRHAQSNHGLVVSVVDARGHLVNPRDFGIVSERGNKEKRPYLLGFGNTLPDVSTFSQQILISRDRRSARDTSERSTNKPCHLQQFYVNFRKIGLHETIIAPKGYDAFLCTGTCLYPLNAETNVTHHALLQTLAHLASGFIPNPCCTPYKLKPLPVLYFDENNNIVMRKHPNMVATSCTCQ